jgi:hypothetical protein
MALRTLSIGLVALGLGCATFLACGSSDDSGGFSDTADAGGSNGGEGGGGIFGGGGGGGDATPACVGLQCKQTTCSGGGDTTVSGTVFAPNGKLPLYNVIVYVPNSKVADLTQGVTCDQCGAAASGSPVVSTLSNPDGTFTLKNVPVGTNIPLVLQLGKWRRQVTIPEVKKCTDTKLTDPELTRLPKTQAEGNIPHVALTTGSADNLGCMLPKIGLDPSEFGTGADGYNKAVHVYKAGGASGPAAATNATPFWGDATKLKTYDLVLLSCEGSEQYGTTKTAASMTAVNDYLNAGGRIFTTDYMYTWYKYSPDMGMKSVSTIPGGAPVEGSTLPGLSGPGDPLTIDTTFPKGLAWSQWMKAIFPTSPTVQKNQVMMDVVFGNISNTDMTKAQVWGRSVNQSGATMYPRIQTVNVPVGAAADKQCGKGVHIDAHVDSPGAPNTDLVTSAYPAGCTHPLSEGEALLAFFFFDLASCIQNDSQPPPPPGGGVK